MQNTDNRFKPKWLPQISAPFTEVVDGLGQHGLSWKLVRRQPKQLNPLQALCNPEGVDYFVNMAREGKRIPSIYIAAGDEILDGHHRYAAAMHPDVKGQGLICVKIMADFRDAVRILNKIEDLYQERQKGPDQQVLTPLSQLDRKPGNFTVFSSQKLDEKSADPQLLSLKQEGDSAFKYELELENCLDSSWQGSCGESCRNLLQTWYPNVKWDEKVRNIAISEDAFYLKMTMKACKQRGYDGVHFAPDHILIIP